MDSTGNDDDPATTLSESALDPSDILRVTQALLDYYDPGTDGRRTIVTVIHSPSSGASGTPHSPIEILSVAADE